MASSCCQGHLYRREDELEDQSGLAGLSSKVISSVLSGSDTGSDQKVEFLIFSSLGDLPTTFEGWVGSVPISQVGSILDEVLIRVFLPPICSRKKQVL